MDNMETTDKVKEILKETMTSVWKEGYEAGTLTTCAILYKTLLNAGIALGDDEGAFNCILWNNAMYADGPSVIATYSLCAIYGISFITILSVR